MSHMISMADDPIQRAEAERIGARLRSAREATGGSRLDLAEAVGTDISMIRKVENGQRIPSVFLVQSLCYILGVSPQYLLWGSLQGVEGELAAKLLEKHPELRAATGHPPKPFPGKTRKMRPNVYKSRAAQI